MRKLLALSVAAAISLSFMGCGGSKTSEKNTSKTSASVKQYADIELGKDFTNLSATISLFNHRTDMDSDSYLGTTWKQYLAEFNKMYPNITVKITTDTNYADDALTHLQSGDYETIMMIPAVDKADLSEYFLPYGDLATMKKEINYADTWMYNQIVYGVPSTATTQGLVYNKKVFAEAGITKLPSTPDEFIEALKLIRKNTKAIPLYTNYAAGWTMGAWDAYISINATGDSEYQNRKLIHTKDPFKNYKDDTHPYSVYKILYDAAANNLIEPDYTTTDWEGCKGMINNGEIGVMALGSWAYPQMEAGGPNAKDIGYMPFPITINGRQYAMAGADYSFGINKNASDDEKQAALVFVKWMTEKSGFSYNEDGLPVDADAVETKLVFDNVEFIKDDPAVSGEEDFLNLLNSDSELNINNGGNSKIQKIIEHAVNHDKDFDEIMAEWNAAWTEAQKSNGIEIKY